MKPNLILFVVLASSVLLHPSSFGQGSLTPPPGAPAPTMKSLDQIEPRTRISSLPFSITASGAYYLTGSLTSGGGGLNGIDVNADNVTIDLSGFEIAGIAGGSSGISIGGGRFNVAIRHGTVRGWPSFGIFAGSGCTEIRVEDVRVLNNSNVGINLRSNSTVEHCEIRNNGAGIACNDACKISNCTVSSSIGAATGITLGQTGIITNCVSNGNGGNGIQVGAQSTVIGCTASSNGVSGFVLGDNSSISNCVANSNSAFGFGGASPEHCVFTNCSASGNTGSGFSLSNGASLHNCSTFNNVGSGILVGEGSALTNCVARSNQGTSGIAVGAACTVIGCVARVNNSTAATSAGITAASECLVSQCVASNTTSSAAATATTGMGINVGAGSTVERCTVQGNKGDGIRASGSCILMNNMCDGNGPGAGDGAGIHTTGVDNRIESNNVTNNDRGIDVDAAGSLIIKNSASGNPVAAGTANYEIAANNACQVVVTALTGGFTGASGGTALGSTDPWVNYSY